MFKNAMFAAAALAACAASASLRCDDAAAREKALSILSRMTPEEKVSLCAGSGTMSLPAVPRLGITNEWQFSDNSQTVRQDVSRWEWGGSFTNDEATVLPNLSALASTWNVELAALFGHVMGEQARARGKDMMLGPGVNIMRTPLCGRNWEYFSEDPVLISRLVVPEIRAMQSHDVAACVKHFCANFQENDRHENDAVMDSRTLNEIYLPAFRAAVKEAGVHSVMTSYNLLNGVRCSQSPYLLKGILRERWGFDGMIVTDWGGQRSTVKAALGGAGTEMNRGKDIRFFANPRQGTLPLLDAVKEGKVPMAVVDDIAFRVLYTMAKTRFLDPENRKGGERLTEKHRKAALEIAEEAVVLLKNDAGVLPLDPARTKKLLVVGRLADTEMTKKGWSAEGKPLYEITPWKGLVEYFDGTGAALEKYPLVASDMKDKFHAVVESSIRTFDTNAVDSGMTVRAWETAWFDGKTAPEGEPDKTGFSVRPGLSCGEAAPVEGFDPVKFCVAWKAKILAPETGVYAFSCTLDKRGGAEMSLDGQVLASGREIGRVEAEASLQAGVEYDFSVVYSADTGRHSMEFGWLLPSERGSIEDLRAKAASADAVLVFTGTEVGHGRALECEGGDRPDMKLADGHDEAISAILSWNLPNVAVIVHSGSPVEMPWLAQCKTLVQQPYLGQEAGRALARVLFGDVNPSGRLPCTWPARYEDTAVATLGECTPRHSICNERFYVGYRWHDRQGVAPAFPFGYGTGYTTFSIAGAGIAALPDGFAVSATVVNTGTVPGKETVQIYASYPDAKAERCVKELKGFAKTPLLAPGESCVVSAPVSFRDLARWDEFSNCFFTDAGAYDFSIGRSAAAIDAKVRGIVPAGMGFED